MGLKIFDAYRPYSATKLMWDMIHDERYVANLANGSGHNRGIAIDLTLTNIDTGEALDTGTAFDNFADSAHHSFTKQLPPQLSANRELLKTTMEKFGFKSLATVWWHYSFSSVEVYDLLDTYFRILQRKIK
ncbi:MAG: M15 family metallopeptidase [Ferruginibacter sp.]